VSATENRIKILDKLKEMTDLIYHRYGPTKAGMWRGHRCLKYPTDLLLYAEIIHDMRPDYIIETGTRWGGSALYLADICELEGHGHVITVEIDEGYEAPKHKRLTKLIGDSAGDAVLEEIEKIVGDQTTLILLDSDHSPEHVMRELKAYSQIAKKGDYIVVEDQHQEGADEAVNEFLKKCGGMFKRDTKIEKYGIHCGRDGFLKKVKS